MEYGILVAELVKEGTSGYATFQIIGAVDSLADARLRVCECLGHANSGSALYVERYVIHRRNVDGYYLIRETIDPRTIGA